MQSEEVFTMNLKVETMLRIYNKKSYMILMKTISYAFLIHVNIYRRVIALTPNWKGVTTYNKSEDIFV